jgi:hypothetical protein
LAKDLLLHRAIAHSKRHHGAEKSLSPVNCLGVVGSNLALCDFFS